MSDEEQTGYANLLGKVYDDALSPALREASKIGVDAVKVIRLALFPLQFGGALQDRLDKYLARAIGQVPEQNRIAPVESLALPIAEKLKFQEETSPISELYVNLLSRAMDRERVNEAHPAFIFIISQLAPAEVKILQSFYDSECRMLFRNEDYRTLANEEDVLDFLENGCHPAARAILEEMKYDYSEIDQPEIFMTLIEHLYTLGLICSARHILDNVMLGEALRLRSDITLYPLEITGLGKLFHRACIR